MASAIKGLGCARSFALGFVALAVFAAGPAQNARALEAFEGALQFHGFAEMQLRALDEKFKEELDLAQWYNVLNLEFEVDLISDGWGPIDLLSGYLRVEGRYDAIYSEGFRMFRGIDTYGDNSNRLPERLRDALDADYSGVVDSGLGPAARIDDKKPAPLAPVGERRGFPGYDTLFAQAGADNTIGTADDPARYVHEAILDYKFALKDFRGPQSGAGSTQVLGPWLPKNYIVNLALTADKANPFRGRMSPNVLPTFTSVFGGGGALGPSGARFYEGDPTLASLSVPGTPFFGFQPTQIDKIDPTSAFAMIRNASPSAVTAKSRIECERRTSGGLPVASCQPGDFLDPFDPDGPGPLVADAGFFVQALNNPDFLNPGSTANGDFSSGFGGDFSGIVPCLNPTDDTPAASQTPVPGTFQGGLAWRQRFSVDENRNCIPGGFAASTDVAGVTSFGQAITQAQNVQILGGVGENPFRPAPDLANTANNNAGLLQAQGLYLPSNAFVREVSSGHLDHIPFNFDETQRAFNRGASQQRTKEVKEAYIDLEVLDSRLWMRFGLQNIVWGKTELFRTTDQFNPTDLALASLPSLEESRIALWSARFVYSLYDVGAFEDVRLEFAFNFDKYEPSDLGACGEPYTPDVVCSLTFGVAAHSYLGLGVAGIDRPESPWKEPGDLEVGGRIEWRWDRFSFALTDFYGFSDFPFADSLFFYERNVDPATGRPLVARLPGQLPGTCANGGHLGLDGNSLAVPDAYNSHRNRGLATDIPVGIPYNTAFASHPYSVTPGQTPALVGSSLPDGTLLDGNAAIRGGIGTDPDCLRPGGAPGFPNAFRFDTDILAQTNALQNHHANQQIFAWTCSNTIGIAASLDPGACAWTLFVSRQILGSESLSNPPTFIEGFQPALVGNPNGATTMTFMGLAVGNAKPAGTPVAGGGQLPGLVAYPVASNNRLFNDPLGLEFNGVRSLASCVTPECVSLADTNGDGVLSPVPDACADLDPATVCAVGAPGVPLGPGVDIENGCFDEDPNTACSFDIGLDTNGNGSFDISGCADNDESTPCDLGGFDGFDTRVGTRNDGAPTFDNSLTNEQRALLGCGPFYGTRCDSTLSDTQWQRSQGGTFYGFPQSGIFGGIDFLNMEGSVLVQSWLGVEGTQPGQKISGLEAQPGTIGPLGTSVAAAGGGSRRTSKGYLGGPVCTRFVENQGLVKLPGCRGVASLSVDYDASSSPMAVKVSFEAGYLPSVDGCVIGHQVRRANGTIVPVTAVGASPQLARELIYCSRATTRRAVGSELITGFDADQNPITIDNPNCMGSASGAELFINGVNRELRICNSELVTLEELPLIHPVAGCIESPVNPRNTDECLDWYQRDLVDEFFAIDRAANQTATAQLFQNELASFSYNFMNFLVLTSCDLRSPDLDGNTHSIITPLRDGGERVESTLHLDPECFNPAAPYTPGRCSLTSPQLCTNVKGLLGAAGVTRNTVRAGGSERYGRRTFLWHSGGEIVLRYDQRNVLGLSADFGEDVTKTNWGVEFTWIEGIPFSDADSVTGISDSDAINLTVSVDRPTFVNFLNPNRTFFVNSQWFFSYLPDHRDSFTSNGPLNVLFTFAVFTGYFQDRLNPTFVTVYDFNSQSGGLLPSLQYRFTEAFSVTIGLLYFFGRTELSDMPLQEIGPAQNRAGKKAYSQGNDNLLSLIRKRDEVFLRLRWTF